MSSSRPGTPQRVTRSRSSNPTTVAAHETAPGPPVPVRDTSTKMDTVNLSNPFHVDLVIPYDISAGSQSRSQAQAEIRSGYETLLTALEGEGGLKIATKAGETSKGKEEVWVFIGADDSKVNQLVERERLLDQSHNLPPHASPIPPSSATRIRLLHALLTSPQIQNGLGIMPGQGKWKRVKSIAALHDEESDQAWLRKWTHGDWRVGILTGLGDNGAESLGRNQPPPVHLYFNFLTTYSLSLVPLSIISALFYLFTPSDSYPPLYAFILSTYSTIFVAVWRIRERKLAIRWGTKGCESVAVGRLRPEYVASMGLDRPQAGGAYDGNAVDAIRAGDDFKRDIKMAASIPIIVACGVILGCVIMGIFVLEAFVGQAYEGVGKQVVPLVPTALFVLVVPQLTALYQAMSKALVSWEDHPTPVGADKSLTGKTFAMNGIVAYLQLFLSAYVYVPFGPFIMAYVQRSLSGSRVEGENIKFAANAEKTGLGPRSSNEQLKSIKADRLKGQLFAYTVTNQAVNAFVELGLPYVMEFITRWREGDTTIKEAAQSLKNGEKELPPPRDEAEVEKRFLKKVKRELQLPEYSLFTDYAEMVTQFGYVTVWSIVWPLAPVFALINNYIEIRSDAMKICKHVRRPIGDRVETIGSWLQALSVISWIGAVTNATLVYLFRPSDLGSHNPAIPATGSVYLHRIVSQYDLSPTWRTILPTLIPLAAVALTASHAFIILRWIIDFSAERMLWKGSQEEMEYQKLGMGRRNIDAKLQELNNQRSLLLNTGPGGFWNGGEEGAMEIGRSAKSE